MKFFIIILNLIAFLLNDHRDRIYTLSESENYNTINIIARYKIEIFCYSFFTFELVFGIIAMGAFLEKGSYLKDRWRLFYSIVLLISWISYAPENSLSEIFMCIRFLGFLRILNLFEPLKNHLNNFVKALTSVYKVFLAIFFTMFFYALVGLYLFYGLEENRCRTTPEPINNKWIVVENSFTLCGNFQCEIGFSFFFI